MRAAAGADGPGRCRRRWSTCSAICGPWRAESLDRGRRADSAIPACEFTSTGSGRPTPGRKMGHLTVLDPDPEICAPPRTGVAGTVALAGRPRRDG